MATVIEVEQSVQRIWRGYFGYDLDATLEMHLQAGALVGIQAALEAALAEELTQHLGLARYARSAMSPKPACLSRSGFFRRQVITSLGTLESVRVPKLRSGNKERAWQILTRYQQAMPILLDKALYLYTLGLSLRDLQEALYLFSGHLFSRDALNRITRDVQEAVDDWYHRPIASTPEILLVDGVWVKLLTPTGESFVDKSGHTRQQHCLCEQTLLVAMGVDAQGQTAVLGYVLTDAETKADWQRLFEHLSARGLAAETIQLVVSDGAKGLLAAMATHLPNATMQRCVVHKVRGFQRYLCYAKLDTTDEDGQPLTQEQARKQRRQQMKREALDIFQQPTLNQAQEQLHAFVDKWNPIEPKAIHNFLWGIKRCFPFYQYPSELHPSIRSTNRLERFFREFRAKADEIGAFPNQLSCRTVFQLVVIRDHTKHQRPDFANSS